MDALKIWTVVWDNDGITGEVYKTYGSALASVRNATLENYTEWFVPGPVYLSEGEEDELNSIVCALESADTTEIDVCEACVRYWNDYGDSRYFIISECEVRK